MITERQYELSVNVTTKGLSTVTPEAGVMVGVDGAGRLNPLELTLVSPEAENVIVAPVTGP